MKGEVDLIRVLNYISTIKLGSPICIQEIGCLVNGYRIPENNIQFRYIEYLDQYEDIEITGNTKHWIKNHPRYFILKIFKRLVDSGILRKSNTPSVFIKVKEVRIQSFMKKPYSRNKPQNVSLDIIEVATEAEVMMQQGNPYETWKRVLEERKNI